MNAWYYNKTGVDNLANLRVLKTDFDASLNANYYDKTSVDAGFYSKAAIDTSLNNGFYNKTRIDSSINSIISNYSTISYVDGRFTTLTGVAPSQLDTLAEIAAALQGDASFGMTVYAKITASDASINTIRTNLANTDSSVNTIRTNLSNTDSSVNTIRTNLANTDSSVNTIRTNLSGYVTSNDSSVNAIQIGLAATDSSVNTIRTNLSSYVLSNDASLSTIRLNIQQLSSTGSIQDPSINQLIAYNAVQDTSINLLPSKVTIDNSLNSYYTKTDADASINSVLGSYALSSSLNSYYTKTDADASINSVLGSYYTKTAADSSINSVLGSYSTISYVDGRFTTLTGVAPSQLDTLAEIAVALQGDASFGTTVYAKIASSDASINTIRTSLSGYTLKTEVDASLALYSTKSVIDASLTAYLQHGSSNDISLNGNVRLGNGIKTVSINKTPNALYSLDVSGSAYFTNNIDMSGSINAYGIFNNGDVFDSASDGLSAITYGNLTALQTVVYPFSGSYTNIATSSNGKYITAVSYGGAAVFSNNYGDTFTDISNSVLGSFKLQPSMSSTGQYQYLPSTGGNCYSTNNYGTTWVNDNASASIAVAISGSGKYVLKIPSIGVTDVSLSSNFGSTYTRISVGSGLTNLYACVMSETGQVMAICSNLGTGVKISQNFGKTWNTVTTSGIPYMVSLSASGKYILAGSSLSNSFGISFEALPAPANISSILGTTISANGQYMAISSTNTGYYSLDYGRTWVSRVSTGTNPTLYGSNMAMTSNGGIIYQATTTGVIRLSASQSSVVANSIYVTNNIDMSGSVNAMGFYINGDVYDSASDGLSTDRYTSFFTSETQPLSTAFGAGGLQSTAMSNDGKYINIIDYVTGQNFFSTNYGTSFTDISGTIPGSKINRLSPTISATGKYMFTSGINSGIQHYSTNYGATWTADPSGGRMTAMSYSGKYMVKAGTTRNIKVSSNYGATYTDYDTGAATPLPFLIAMSYTGQIISAVAHNATGVKISRDFGRTWTIIATSNNSNNTAMSASGRYILAGSNLSTDFGTTFNPVSSPANISAPSGISISANGQYMVIAGPSTVYYSVDYGTTWVSRASNGTSGNSGTGSCVAMPANASFVIHVTTNGVFKYNSFTATDVSLALCVPTGSSSDVSFNGNVQLGNGIRNISINKIPNALFALDVSGSTNMSGNLALTKAASIPMGSFDLSAVNMSVFNVSEKFTAVTLSATPTLDYSTGGIFYMSGVNAALTTISITNVPTVLNRSISVTLILAQTGGAGTFCFTTGTLNVNGTSITYLKPDATALAAPSSNRSIIINQFIIIWNSATPTVIAYLSSMG